MFRQSKKDLLNVSSSKPIVCFGASALAIQFVCGIEIYDRIKFVCDNDPKKIGTKILGYEVHPASLLSSLSPDDVVIVNTSTFPQPEIEKAICSYGRFDVWSAYTLTHAIFEPLSVELFDNYNEILQTAQMLVDETSRDLYLEIVRRRMRYGECDFSDLVIWGDVEYLVPQFFGSNPPRDEIIIDCGAYNGDTMLKFMRHFQNRLKKIYAFECIPENLKKLEECAATQIQLREYAPEILVMPYGCGNKNGKVFFAESQQANGSFMLDARKNALNALPTCAIHEVQTVRLDDVMPIGERITFIKADIEGSEYAMLQGAKRIIQTYKPKLAISIYHEGADYYRIPQLIKEFVPEYNLAVRHHKKNHVDTDLYAWVD